MFNEGRINFTVELEKFAKLEDKIKVIVNEKVSLKKQIQILEETLKSKVKAFDEERNSVRARVDSLLDLIADVDLAK